MSVPGVDYAFPPRPDIGQLAAAGIKFACRYGGAGSDSKQLDPGEAQALSQAGIWIVANVEGAYNGMLGGFNVGKEWARDAHAHFTACGMPPDRPIYLSVDFDVTAPDWPRCADALRGAASVIGAARVGVYGGRRAIEWARRDGVASWFWQTYAWSGGVWVPGNHIEQYRNHVELAGATLDLDRAPVGDYGQWMIGQSVEDDMSYDRNTAWRLQEYLAGKKTIVVPLTDQVGSEPEIIEPNMPQQQWDRIEQLVAGLAAPVVDVDYTLLAEALRPIVAQESEKAVRRVLGTLDNLSAVAPEVPAKTET